LVKEEDLEKSPTFFQVAITPAPSCQSTPFRARLLLLDEPTNYLICSPSLVNDLSQTLTGELFNLT